MGTNLIIRDADFSKNAIFKPGDIGTVEYSLFNRYFSGVASDRITTDYDLYSAIKVWTIYANVTYDFPLNAIYGSAINAWGQTADSEVGGFQIYTQRVSEKPNIVVETRTILDSSIIFDDRKLGEISNNNNNNVKIAFRRNNNDMYFILPDLQSSWVKARGTMNGFSPRRNLSMGARSDGDSPFKGTINSCILYLENIESVDNIKKLAEYY